MQLIHECGLYTGAAYTRVQLIHGCGLYTGAAYTRVQLIHGCGLYTGAAYTRVQLIHGCSLYTGAAYTRVRLIHECSLYTGAAYTRVRLIHESSRHLLPSDLLIQLWFSFLFLCNWFYLNCCLNSSDHSSNQNIFSPLKFSQLYLFCFLVHRYNSRL